MESVRRFTAVAPEVLHPQSSFHVAVTTHGADKQTTVTVQVSGRETSSGENHNYAETVVVEPNVTKLVELKIGDVGPGSYSLTSSGVGGVEFTESVSLSYSERSFFVFIQTDKGIYKPSQTVRFRVLLLDKNLKPGLTYPVDLHVTDGQQNRVKQWQQVALQSGLFAADLPLSDCPVLGDWTVTACVRGQTFSRTFQVDEYVLPTFSVTAQAADTATHKTGEILVDVEAKYTYGRPVQGEVTVTAERGHYWPPSAAPESVQKTVPIDGKATVSIDIKDLKLDSEHDQHVELKVSVEEAFTQRVQTAATSTTVYRNQYKYELIDGSKPTFKEGDNYLASIKIMNRDGSPVQDDVNLVTVGFGFSYGNEGFTSRRKRLQPDGVVQLEVIFPPGAYMLRFKVQYKDDIDFLQDFHQPPLYTSRTFSDDPIVASLTPQKPKVGEEAELLVELNKDRAVSMSHVSYLVLGRGDLVAAGSVAVGKDRSARIPIDVSASMAPSAAALLYSVDAEGEVQATSLHFDVKGLLQNYVALSVSTALTEPGRNVELKVRAKPNSIVGLLGVDQSVLLKQEGNDISEEYVQSEVMNYRHNVHEGMHWATPAPAFQNSEVGHKFQDAGTVLLTNGTMKPFSYLCCSDTEEACDMLGVAMPAGSARLARCAPLSGSALAPPPPRVRKNFPETWIWEVLQTGADGRASLIRTAPDTTTTWVLNGLSVDPVYGLGLVPKPINLTVFRSFFLSINLPYSVIRGEVLAVPVTVFNYMDRNLSAEVTMEDNGDFDFGDDLNDTIKVEKHKRSKLVSVASQGVGCASFLITPRRLGYITVKVSAVSDLAGDAVERRLRVKAEGDTQYKNKALFVDLQDTRTFDRMVALDIPKDIVIGSERIEVSVVGDILGPSTEHLDSLIRMPYGCGEQNMLNFVPNIVILDYLKNTGKVREAVADKAKKCMEAGYQRELTYQHDDCSFSAFGNHDPKGSTWLTAFVAKSFRQAEAHISIDTFIVEQALDWLASLQADSGSFPEEGKVFHSDMQGGAANGLALTSYVIITFLVCESGSKKHEKTVQKALDHVAKHIEEAADSYAIAITAYALALAQHPAKEMAFRRLQSKAITRDGQKWWNKEMTEEEEENPWNKEPNSLAVEMTSYALLTYLQRGLMSEAIPILSYLLAQRNSNGGFVSTQDTVIGLQALAALAERLPSGHSDVKVTFSPSGGPTATMSINNHNATVLHKREIVQGTRKLKISAEGSGCVLAQVSYSYNVDSAGEWPLFSLKPKVEETPNAAILKLRISSSFIPGSYGTESNMAVMEVTLPSGFTADRELLSQLVGSEGVSRAETKDADTVVVLYFDKMGPKEFSPTLLAYRTHQVANQKPVPVTIYDYYNQARRAREFYAPLVSTTPADICDV